MAANPLLPAVEVDAASQPFFDGTGQGRLLLQRCHSCGALQLGSMRCTACAGGELDWIPASGKGVVHSFVVMHVSYHPALVAPYTAAIVELHEGPRLPVPVPRAMVLRIGQQVLLDFLPTQGGPSVPALRFVPTPEPLP